MPVFDYWIIGLLIRHHQKHYNGCGYSDNLSGEDVPISARIISIADSYDAMAETRSYSRRRSHSEIMGAFRQFIEVSEYKAD